MSVEALDAKRLAALLGVTVWSVKEIENISKQNFDVLIDECDDSWSALVMREETRFLVVYKPVSSSGRENSVIMHELSHIILGHRLAKVGVVQGDALVPANYNQDQENEADWLAGTLLLPRPALLQIRYDRCSDNEACQKYNVSKQMLAWRFRMTGVDFQTRQHSYK